MEQRPGTSNQDALYSGAAGRYALAIERLARGYEADSELRRDLVQEIHTALWRSFGYFEGQCSERSWVYRVAHNVAVSHLIARRRLKTGGLVTLEEIADLAGPANPETEADARRVVDRLLATIHRLKPADRQVILLYLEDLTAAEIGEVTGLSAGGVAVRIHRIKALLREPFQSGENRT
jgi:RNA polymerase sigma-70 factor (ECF subfamily)